MKNKIITVFLFSFLLPIHFSLAYIQSSLDIGGSDNPIYIQEIKDPAEQQRQENLSLESRLKAQYGYSIYSSCHSSVCGKFDWSNPYEVRSCLGMLETWLGSNMCFAQREKSRSEVKCTTGFVNSNGSCISRDSSCRMKWANSVWTGEVNSQGGSICGCATGYQWNGERTSCISVPVIPTEKAPTFAELQAQADLLTAQLEALNTSVPAKTKDQICNDAYLNSYFTGELNDQGGLTCDCKTGYQWDTDQTVCIATPLPPAPQPQKAVEIHVQEPTIKNTTEESITATALMESADSQPAIEQKQPRKNLWSIVKSWFGF